MRQAQLSLAIISKGRFDKSEPTIHKGEDLDIPTYVRRGVGVELGSHGWSSSFSLLTWRGDTLKRELQL